MKLASWFHSIWQSLFERAQVEDDLAEQVAAHLSERTSELLASGLSPAEANRQARLEFGSVERYKEECRESLGARLLHDLGADIRYGLRTLRHNPVLTGVLLLCLALGIGANTAIFSVANAVLMKSLPIRDPEGLVSLRWDSKKRLPAELRTSGTGYGDVCFPYQTYLKIREESPRLRPLGITGVLAYAPAGFLSP